MDTDFRRERRKQRRYEQIDTDKPRCPDCPETDWRCFTATSMPRCANCAIKARRPGNNAAKSRCLRELGSDNPCCAMCGESDWRCIELHHIAGRRHDRLTVLICANDHLRVSDDQKDHPSMSLDIDPFIARLSSFLRGLADALFAIAERLIKFADELLGHG